MSVRTIGSASVVVMNVLNEVIQTGMISSALLHTVNQEEANTKVVIHFGDVESRIPKVMIKTVETNIKVLAVGTFHDFSAVGLQELWIMFGTGMGL